VTPELVPTTPRKPLHVFVAPAGNAFMRDIAAWIAEAGAQLGRPSTLHDDGSVPDDPAAINLVVAPHEFYLLGDLDDRAIDRAARISVPVCTEQPGTPWFDIGEAVAGAGPLVLDINAHGVAALRERGHVVRHLRLGGVPGIRADEAGAAERDIDLLFLGGRTDRRAARLAAMAPVLWDRACDLRLFSFSRPVHDGVPGLVFGDDKYRLLARSRILLNIHRHDAQPGYFEWARMVEAMANGCCVVTEPVTGLEPLVPGEHLVVTDDLEGEVTRLLDDPEECRRIGEAGRRAVLDDHPLTGTLGPILDELDGVAPDLSPCGRRVPRYRRRMIVAQQHPLLPAFRPTQRIRRRLYRALMAETALQREIERVRCLVRHGVDDHVERIESAAYAGAEPEVSIVVTLYDYAHVVVETLDSLVASRGVAFEIVVVDDHSTDDGREVVRRFVDDHPDVPIVVLGSDVNRGLPTARNLGFAAARAAKVMVMDADNLVYPNALRVLSDTLDDDPDAAFAYSTLEEFGVTQGVRSAMAFHPAWLCEANYIDAQAMLRRAAWGRHGGYRTDDELVFGWEDWELWLRLAAAGEHGVHVPRMLGRYRTQEASMIATSNLVADEMLTHLRELHPTLPWPDPEPDPGPDPTPDPEPGVGPDPP
jgi:hypothetical protein